MRAYKVVRKHEGRYYSYILFGALGVCREYKIDEAVYTAMCFKTLEDAIAFRYKRVRYYESEVWLVEGDNPRPLRKVMITNDVTVDMLKMPPEDLIQLINEPLSKSRKAPPGTLLMENVKLVSKCSIPMEE